MDGCVMDGCVMCMGPLVWLGRLGDLAWFRCRNCGMDQEVPFEDLPEDVAEAVSDFA